MNEHFPVNTISLIRGAIVAQKNNFFDSYVEIVLSGLWEQSLKLDSPEVTIKKGRFGYTMEVPSIGKRVHVKKIK